MDSLSDQKLDLINVAIQRLMDERKSANLKFPFLGLESDDDHLLLSKLLSQLESLKGDSETNPPEESSPVIKEVSSNSSNVGLNPDNSGDKPEGTKSVDSEEILKELKQVKRQNTITHWLLSIMIVLTVTWQVSEVSLMWKLKDGLNHPFRSVGSAIAGMFKGRPANGRDGEESTTIPIPIEMLPIPSVTGVSQV